MSVVDKAKVAPIKAVIVPVQRMDGNNIGIEAVKEPNKSINLAIK